MLPWHWRVITGVDQDRAAAEAGINGPTFVASVDGHGYPTGGDIVFKADGQAVERAEDLQRIVFAKEAGDVVRLHLWRDGNVRVLDVTLRPVATEDGPTEPAR